jgi:glucose-1-phosphate thymidylyltransferase
MINKHLLPVGRQPMIQYGVDKLIGAGIDEILLITGKEWLGSFALWLGSGAERGVRFTYRVQDAARGIADGMMAAEGFILPGEKFVLLLGDNLFEDDLTEQLHAFRDQPDGARVLLKRVSDSSRYGVPVMEGDRIIRIEEKPAHPATDYCVTGIYFYDDSVFEIARTIRPSARDELEITDVNNAYARAGKLSYGILQGWWTDAGTFESLHEAAERLMNGDDCKCSQQASR